MKSKTIFAPQIDRWRPSSSHQGHSELDARSKKMLGDLFKELSRLKTCGSAGDEVYSLWMCADRGPMEAFGDWEESVASGDVKDRAEYEAMWKEYYPNEKVWYEMAACRNEEGYMAVYLKHRQWIEIRPDEKRGEWLDMSELIQWMIDGVGGCVAKLEKGTYNEEVNRKLPVEMRTGTITRQDVWRIFPEEKADFFKNFSESEVREFAALTVDYTDDYPKPAGRLEQMTANDFYRFCSIGYHANAYSGLDALSLREQYEAHADGRDEGLGEIDADSPEAFQKWYTDRKRHGGHPWEVCRGGNLTHVALFVRHDEKGYYLEVDGRSWSRCVETAKFFLALSHQGLPVVVDDGKAMSARFLGTDKIGIVPDGVFPRYCESLFPDETILDFMNLPFEKRNEVASAAVWQPLDRVELRDKRAKNETDHK